jgi:hypothetical protein
LQLSAFITGPSGKSKKMTLPAGEFIRRFLLHVLPHRLMKIRYYGFSRLKSQQITKEVVFSHYVTETNKYS